ncbi:DNA-entry nuclease [Bacillus cereus group sp. BfR-BA-01380]|uniref:DNA-entry nuclease n=1 Tax=Bacillus cereus group sp. BfR-BA-01380 TaxID=2920324 RepID=UPI001F585F9B|nr:DNA-entry nuclease [Bacillus cereus group sp. BfR-BA-01380]
MEFQYDNHGRMKYHPGFHFSHKLPFTEEDLEYLCKFYDFDDKQAIAFALGKTEKALADRVSKLKKAGMFHFYKTLNKYYV